MSTSTTATRPSHVVLPPAPETVGFELMLDRSAYTRTPQAALLTATLILRCPVDAPVSLSFSNGQQFDLALFDASGRQVGLWSTGRVFSDLARTVEFKGEHRWVATMALPAVAGALSPASYLATGYLTGTVVATQAPAEGGVHPDTIWGGTGIVGLAPFPPPSSTTAGRRYSASVAFTVREDPVIPTSPTA